MQSIRQGVSFRKIEASVKKMASSITTSSLSPDEIVEAKNLYKIGPWDLTYNSDKNTAEFSFTKLLTGGLKISVRNSTGWVRLLSPLGGDVKPGIYSVALSARSLTDKPEASYRVFVFKTLDGSRFDRHSELELKNGKYSTKLHLGDGVQNYWMGFETLDESIDLYVAHLKIDVETVGRKLKEMAEECNKIELPLVMTEAKSKEYVDIDTYNSVFDQKAKSDELGFVLEYACSLRRVEMPDTFIRMIKYLAVRFHQLSDSQKSNMKAQLRIALLISHDRELMDIIYMHCPEMVFQMDLNTDMFSLLAGQEDCEAPEADHRAFNSGIPIYDFQNDVGTLSKVIRQEMREDPNLLKNKPHMYAVMANVFASKTGKESAYLSYLNKYLNSQSIPEISCLSFSDDIFLSSLKFKNSPDIAQGPLVSVIMSAFNAEKTIDYAVSSILDQTYRNIELLVCDDGSTDATVELLMQLAENDSRVKVYKSRGNQGTYNIRNDMVAVSKGEFITFQDSDDYSVPIRIQEQVNNLLEKDTLLTFTRWFRVRNDGKVVVFFDGLISRFCVVSAMGHRSVFERLPRFRSSYVAADTEFYENAKKLLGMESIYLDNRPLILGLWSETSLTRQADLTAENNGFVAPRRRAYADIAARQRVLGSRIVTNAMVDEKLKSLGIYRESCGSETVQVSI